MCAPVCNNGWRMVGLKRRLMEISHEVGTQLRLMKEVLTLEFSWGPRLALLSLSVV